MDDLAERLAVKLAGVSSIQSTHAFAHHAKRVLPILLSEPELVAETLKVASLQTKRLLLEQLLMNHHGLVDHDNGEYTLDLPDGIMLRTRWMTTQQIADWLAPKPGATP